MRRVIYFDTSALVKWYLNEPRSDEVEKYIQEEGPVDISELTLVEMRSLLARHRREGQLDLKKEIAVFACFEEDVRQNFLVCHPFPADIAAGAVNLISMLTELTEFSIRLMRIAATIDDRIEPHPFNVERFNCNDPLADEIQREGIQIA